MPETPAAVIAHPQDFLCRLVALLPFEIVVLAYSDEYLHGTLCIPQFCDCARNLEMLLAFLAGVGAQSDGLVQLNEGSNGIRNAP